MVSNGNRMIVYSFIPPVITAKIKPNANNESPNIKFALSIVSYLPFSLSLYVVHIRPILLIYFTCLFIIINMLPYARPNNNKYCYYSQYRRYSHRIRGQYQQYQKYRINYIPDYHYSLVDHLPFAFKSSISLSTDALVKFS